MPIAKTLRFEKRPNGNVFLYNNDDGSLITSFEPSQNLFIVKDDINKFRIAADANTDTPAVYIDYRLIDGDISIPLIATFNRENCMRDLADNFFFLNKSNSTESIQEILDKTEVRFSWNGDPQNIVLNPTPDISQIKLLIVKLSDTKLLNAGCDIKLIIERYKPHKKGSVRYAMQLYPMIYDKDGNPIGISKSKVYGKAGFKYQKLQFCPLNRPSEIALPYQENILNFGQENYFMLNQKQIRPIGYTVKNISKGSNRGFLYLGFRLKATLNGIDFYSKRKGNLEMNCDRLQNQYLDLAEILHPATKARISYKYT